MATFPPPTTATFLLCMIGVLELLSKAFIRLLLVRYSLAENTPLEFSPGIPINLGRPAPEPMNTASKPSSWIRASMVTDFPTTTLVSIFTPRAFTFSISSATTAFFGRRNSGMPYTNTPPGSWRASKMVTSYPIFARSPAQVRPAGPEPMTATFFPFFPADTMGLIPFSLAQSATKRSSLPMEMGSPLIPRIHLPSH